MYTLGTGCKKWYAHAACWNEHAWTLHGLQSTFGPGDSERALNSSNSYPQDKRRCCIKKRILNERHTKICATWILMICRVPRRLPRVWYTSDFVCSAPFYLTTFHSGENRWQFQSYTCDIYDIYIYINIYIYIYIVCVSMIYMASWRDVEIGRLLACFMTF